MSYIGKKWKNMSKWKKVGIVAGGCGLVVVAAPFTVAAATGASIVSALATIGGGAVAAGGFGVAGGIVVTVGGAALSASLGAIITTKFANDPELTAVKNAYAELEKRVAVWAAYIEKATRERRDISAVKSQYDLIYRRYRKVSDKVRHLTSELEKKGKFSTGDVRAMRAEADQLCSMLDELEMS